MSYSSCYFFKQKTAYEMRISDWSSDVCSSDLPDRGAEGARRRRGRAQGRGRRGVRQRQRRDDLPRGIEARGGALPVDLERKSVVKGNSVSVSVDIGGRRIMKSNNVQRQITNTEHQTHNIINNPTNRHTL